MSEDYSDQEQDIESNSNEFQTPNNESPSVVQTQADRSINDLQIEVIKVREFQRGLLAFLGIVSASASIIIAILGWLGISGVIQSVVEERVQISVDESVGQIQEELDQKIESVNIAYATSQAAAIRSEDSQISSSVAVETVISALQSVQVIATQIAIDRGEGEWIVVVASLPNLQSAISEAGRFIRLGLNTVIYHIGDAFVISAGRYTNLHEAETAQLALETDLKRTVNIFDLVEQCPYPVFVDSGYYACYESPPPHATP